MEDIGSKWPALYQAIVRHHSEGPSAFVTFLSEFIQNNFSYSAEAKNPHKSDWEALLEDRYGVCRHAAALLSEVLTIVGIQNVVISGYTRESIAQGCAHTNVMALTEIGYLVVDPTPPNPNAVIGKKQECLFPIISNNYQPPDWLSGKKQVETAISNATGSVSLKSFVANPIHPTSDITITTQTFQKIIVINEKILDWAGETFEAIHPLFRAMGRLCMPESQKNHIPPSLLAEVSTPERMAEVLMMLGKDKVMNLDLDDYDYKTNLKLSMALMATLDKDQCLKILHSFAPSSPEYAQLNAVFWARVPIQEWRSHLQTIALQNRHSLVHTMTELQGLSIQRLLDIQDLLELPNPLFSDLVIAAANKDQLEDIAHLLTDNQLASLVRHRMAKKDMTWQKILKKCPHLPPDLQEEIRHYFLVEHAKNGVVYNFIKEHQDLALSENYKEATSQTIHKLIQNLPHFIQNLLKKNSEFSIEFQEFVCNELKHSLPLLLRVSNDFFYNAPGFEPIHQIAKDIQISWEAVIVQEVEAGTIDALKGLSMTHLISDELRKAGVEDTLKKRYVEDLFQGKASELNLQALPKALWREASKTFLRHSQNNLCKFLHINTTLEANGIAPLLLEEVVVS